MPKILRLAILHMLLAVASGYLIGMSVFGVGFSSSEAAKDTYSIIVYVWQALNAPAGLYVFDAQNVDWNLFLLLQMVTSFIWANVIAFVAFGWKAYRHNQSLHRTPKRLPPFRRR